VATDVRNTLTHEVGHLIGLDNSSDPSVVMHGASQLGDVDKRTLKQDDIDGLCAIYPQGRDPSAEPACRTPDAGGPPSGDAGPGPAPSSGCGCASGPGAAATAAAVPLLLWAAGRGRRRR